MRTAIVLAMGALAGCASHGGQSEPPPITTTTDVVGTMRTTCHEATGDVDRPVDASKRLVQAFVPDTSPAGYHLVNGTGNADGSFVLHDVPADATYVLQIDTSVSSQLTYFVTDQRMLDVRFERQGRCVPSPAVASATFGISTAVTNASSFSFQLDEVALDSFKLGFGVLATGAGVHDDVDGLKASLSWPRNFPLVDAAAGDDLYVLHNRTDQSTDSATGAGVTTQHIVDWFDATGMTFQDAQPASITGAFQSTTSIPSAAQTGTLSVALGPFESLYDGTTRPGRFTVQLLAQPGGGLGLDGFGSAVLLGITLGPFADRPLTATYTTHYSYADPFPASWKRAITVDSQRSHLVRLSTGPTSAIGVITGYHQQMVRRDDDRNPDPVRVRNLPSRCEDPAGESPASVGAGAPSSRPAAEGETPTAEAGHRKRARQQKLFSTKQARGPQHQVKPAASTDEQSGSRAGHFAAKATSPTRVPERDEDLGGVWGAARVQGSSRNTRGPSAQPSSRLGGSNRPGAKAAIAQRKSDGVIVPTMAATNNAAGGKGHERGRVGEEGKRKGMTGRTGSNSPGGRRPPDNVRQLRRRLWVAAKRSPERRFHALYDRMWRGDILREAWKRVKQNRGSAGFDAQTIAEVEQYGAERFLEELGGVLRAGEYRPSATLRRYIPKADGKQRPLGIPTVRDRVVQMAAKLVLEPIFEADFFRARTAIGLGGAS